MEEAISKLKRYESDGPDGLLNEYFIELGYLMVPIIHNIFDAFLSVGYFPKILSNALIQTVYKTVTISSQRTTEVLL